MDFVNRSQQARPSAANGNVAVSGASAGESKKHEHGSRDKGGKWYRVGSAVLVGLVALLILVLIVTFAWGGVSNQQSKYVNKDEYQAVFINVNGTSGGQVYFGHIKALTSQYIDLTNVFYIQNQSSGSSSSNNAYTLIKLGCELHGPEDQMVINQSQVYFWENLKSNGQVTQKIDQYYKQNPSGQSCSTSSSSATQSSASTQTPATTGTTPTTSSTGTTSTSTKKP